VTKEDDMGLSNKPAVVFVGGGHAHLYSLKRTRQLIQAGATVVLIGPDRYHYYSGMGPGMLSRIYEPRQVRFDIRTMVESRGGTFIQGKVASVNPEKKVLTLHTGEGVPYDFASFNVGSYIPMDIVPGAESEAYPVKPIEQMEEVREDILRRIQIGIPKILVIGAGPAGLELTGNIWRLVHAHGAQATIMLAGPHDSILPKHAERLQSLAKESLEERNISIIPRFRAVAMKDGIARSLSDDTIEYDIAILTIGIRPKSVFEKSGLETSAQGALVVNDYLQSTTNPDIFGGGDCITVEGRNLDMVGVYAVREAPIIFHNLMARLKGTSLKKFVPHMRYLLIFNLGDGTGLISRKPLAFRARFAFVLKDYIDRRFMAAYQVSGETRHDEGGYNEIP
jgi:NADH dehydrogenase FAD-containing subunit